MDIETFKETLKDLENKQLDVIMIHPNLYKKSFSTWLENTYWSWRNCIEFRLDYKDNIDRCAFFEELNLGFTQMQDEYIMSQPNFDPYNLSGRDPYYSYMLRNK